MTPPPSSASSLALGPLIFLDATEIEFNPWNPNRMDGFMYQKAVESIQQFGMVDPILVREWPPNLAAATKYQVIDGEHRARACIDLGKPIPAHSVGVVNNTTARKMTIALNEVHGTADPVEMGKLLDGLLSGSSIDELLAGLPMTEDTVKAFTNAAGIEWPGDPSAVPATPSAGTSPGTEERWVERTYRVPSSVAEVLDQALQKARTELEAGGSVATDARALEIIAAEYMAG